MVSVMPDNIIGLLCEKMISPDEDNEDVDENDVIMVADYFPCDDVIREVNNDRNMILAIE